MKTILLSGLAACAVLAAEAQATILSSSYNPAIGSTFTRNDFEDVQAGAGGEQTWDFTDINVFDTDNFVVVDPATTAAGSSFPDADFCLQDEEDFSYYGHEGADFFDYGNADDEGTTIYSTPWRLFQFSFTEGSSWTSNFSNDLGATQSPGGFVGNLNCEVDGWGTINLPNGVSYENTVRVRMQGSLTQYGEDGNQEITTDTYFWLSTDVEVPVLQMGTTTLGEFVSVGGSYTTDFVAGIEEERAAKLSIYPNPAHDAILVQSSFGAGTIQIADLQGKIVQSTTTNASLTRLSTQNIESGIYILSVFQNGQKLTQKLVIE